MADVPFSIDPLPASFGAVLTGFRLTELDDAAFVALKAAWLEYALLIFPDQHLDREAQTAFARRFGELEIPYTPISNVRGDGSLRADDGSDDVMKVLRGNMGWHADSTYMPVQAKGAVFTCQVATRTGGETGFADMRAAYDALDPTLRDRIGPLTARHSLRYSQGKLGHAHAKGSAYSGYGMTAKDEPERPLVKIHPETGRKSLNIGRHAFGVSGLETEASEQLLDELIAFACRPPRVWTHAWTPGDAILWDNRCLLHRALPWDMTEPRVMHHSRIAGDMASEGV